MSWRLEKEQKFARIRAAACRDATTTAPELIEKMCPHLKGTSVLIEDFGRAALDAWETTWKPNAKAGTVGHDWDWRQEYTDHKRFPNRFGAAVWSDGTLCGLGIGKPSNSNSFLCVNLLQGSPVIDHPLKGAIRHIIIHAAISYADHLKIKELRLNRPDPGVMGLYQKMKFELAEPASKPPYCFLRL